MIVIFDFDGTVMNTMPDLADVACRLIADRYYMENGLTRKAYMGTVGASFPEQLEELFPQDDRNPETAALFLEQQVIVYSRARPFLKARAAIEHVIKHGDDVAIISSSPRALTCRVLAREFGKLAEQINLWGREDGTKIEQLTYAAAGYSNVWFIGDAPRDAEIAVKASVRFIGVETTFVAADFLTCPRVAPDLMAAVQEIL